MSKAASLFLKLVIIGGLAVIILIALYMVDSVISERQAYRDQATASISASYASEQRILGPIFVQPYRLTSTIETTTDKGVKKTEERIDDLTYSVFPDELNVKGVATPSIKRHGLYRVPVYEFQGTLAGRFTVPAPAVKGNLQFGVPYIAFRMKDARGIVGTPVLRLNGQAYPVQGAGLTTLEQNNVSHPPLAWGTNLRSLVPSLAGAAGKLDFALDLTLAGTEKLELVPLATANHFELSSPWRTPLFAGQFLPRTHEIGENGFHAVWEISSLASGTQHQMMSGDANIDVVNVSLADLIDPYRLADRAVRYGILFVLLTFGGFFLFELGKRMLVHPVQYLLVGFCLTIFFLLLVSFSEHIRFSLAYLLASTACIGLLTYYLIFVLKSAIYGLWFGAILTVLYAAIYGLLVSEDNALLLGSLLLFGVIAIVMVVTRKIDWYARTSELTAPAVPLQQPD